MAPKKAGGEGSKKAQGQARKADAAASKAAQKDRDAEAAEAQKWEQGGKSSSKADAAAAKKEEAARKKAEKDALLKEEEASLPSKPKSAGAKKAEKKSAASSSRGGGIDSALGSLNATGIDNALDALSLTNKDADKVDRHPERRFKAAYAAFEERRLDEMKDEKGLRRQQKIDQIRKEFEKHPDNPFNQVSVAYDATREEIKDLKEAERAKKEKRLAGSSS